MVAKLEARPGDSQVDEQMHLVEQSGVEQLPHHRYRAAQCDPSDRRVVRQRRDGLDEVAVQLLGIAPREFQRAT
jgi:hypothetical protein